MKSTLLITLEFPPQHGGVGVYYYNVCKNLPPDKLVVLAPDTPAAAEFDRHQRFSISRKKFLAKAAEPKKRLPFTSLIKSFDWNRQLDQVVKKYNVELIQVGNVLPLGLAVMLYCQKKKLPFIVYTHGLDILAPQKILRKKIVLKKVLKKAKSIIANSHFTADQVVKLGIDKEKIVIVNPCPNQIKAEVNPEQLNAVRKRFELDDKKILLTVGRLVDRKGVDLVLKALPTVITKIPDLTYLVIGSGPAEKKLKSLAKQKNLGNHVQFINSVDNLQLPIFYQACDVFVMPARQIGADVEGFGIVYLEANLFGKPVVGGRSGGVPEAIIDSQTGFLVDPNSPDDLAQVIIKLLTDDNLAHRLGLQGLRRVLDEFNWQTQTEKIKTVLE